MASWKKKVQAVADQVAAENPAYFASTLKEVQQDFDAAEKITDAGERYIAFEALEKKIDLCKKEMNQRVSRPIADLRDDVIYGSSLLGVTGGSGVIASFLGGVCTIVAGVAALGGDPVSIIFLTYSSPTLAAGLTSLFSKKHMEKKRNAAIAVANQVAHKGFYETQQSLQNMNLEVVRQKEAILNGDPSIIVNSPRFPELYRRVPQIKEMFDIAAAREQFSVPGAVKINKPAPKQLKQ